MPPRENARQLVRNLRAQPVEIHHAGSVVVVPALGEIELDVVPGAEGGQLAELSRRGVVSVEEGRSGRSRRTRASSDDPERSEQPANGGS